MDTGQYPGHRDGTPPPFQSYYEVSAFYFNFFNLKKRSIKKFYLLNACFRTEETSVTVGQKRSKMEENGQKRLRTEESGQQTG